VDPLAIAALGLVVAGWFVANSQSSKLESRKEARASADRAKVMGAEVALKAIEYRRHPDPVLAIKIKLALELLELELEVMPFLRVRDGPLMGWLIAFQDATTGGSFESPGFDDGLGLEEFSAGVHRALAGLTAQIEKDFKACFK
jgi:hypothetical protein